MSSRTFVLVLSREDWNRRFGHLPASPIGGYEGEGLYDKKTGDYAGTQRAELCRPYIIPDVPAHIGPSGRVVNSRSDQRDEYKRTGTTQWEKLTDRPRGLIDPKVCKDRGIRPCEETLDWMRKTKKSVDDGTYIKPKKLTRAQERKVENAQREVFAKHRDTLVKHGVL